MNANFLANPQLPWLLPAGVVASYCNGKMAFTCPVPEATK